MESIKEILQKIKEHEKELFIVALIFLVAIISYMLGRLSKIEEGRVPVRIEGVEGEGELLEDVSKTPQILTQTGLLVGSKNGTKYHYPWCAGAQNIKEENKVIFQSEEEAKKKGYTPAGNCPGL